jgi:hypothetical protein
MKKTFTLLFLLLCFAGTYAQNRALNFDGANDYVSIPENPSLPTTAMTIEMWFNPNAVAYPAVLISKGQTSTSTYFVIYCSSNDFVASPTWRAGSFLTYDLFTNTGGNRLSYQLPQDLSDTWHHVAITYDGAEKRLYLDGALVGQQALTGTILTNPGSPLLIGNLAPNFTNSYKGTVDEMRIWNVARTATQLSTTSNTEISPSTPGLVAYYQFNQGVANGNNAGITTLTDTATTPNHGTLTNFALTGTTSNWVAGYPLLTPLPIKITSFSASKDAGAVNLEWKTLKNDQVSFEVERSEDGRNFTKIATVTGQPNRSGSEQRYSYLDKTPLQGNNYYRIRVVEIDGNVLYTTTLNVRLAANVKLSVFPNPAVDVLQVQTNKKGKFNIRIQDGMQRIVRTIPMNSNSSLLVTSIDISSLQKGVYYLAIDNEITKFVKQ